MTRSTAARKVVHELEGQRQHPRYRIPGKCEVGRRSHDLIDWSVGGAAIAKYEDTARIGERLALSFCVPLDTFHVYFRAIGEVRTIDRLTGRLGIRFVDQSRRQTDLLRTIVDAHLAGEVVPIDNVIRAPFGKYIGGLDDQTHPPVDLDGGSNRFRVLGFAVLAAMVVTAAFLAARSAYGRVFIYDAAIASVVGAAIELRAPATGHVDFLTNSAKVADGEVVAGIKDRTDRTITLDSPCDCRVASSFVGPVGTFVERGTLLLRLVAPNAPTSLKTVFSTSAIPALRADGAISVAYTDGVTVAGRMAKFTPKLLDAAPAIDGQSSVEIELATGRSDLDAAWDGRPVSVRIDTSPAPWVGRFFGFGI